jgi:gas vesicle protein
MRGLLSGLGRFLVGLVIGAAAGAALAALLTPASGAELQRQLRARLEAARAAGERAERDTVEALRRSFQERVAGDRR